MWFHELDELLPRNAACLRKPTHAPTHANADEAIVDLGCQIVELKDDLGNELDGDTNKFIVIKIGFKADRSPGRA